MPAKSKAQQKFMGMVHRAQKGEKPASATVAKVAKKMKKADAEDYASTKHKGLPKKVTVKEVSKWLKSLEEFRYRKVRGVDARRVTSFVNRGMNEEDLPMSLRKKWEHRKYGREKHLANKYMTENGYDPIQKEGFGGELNEKDKQKFEKERKDNAEVLGYELSGTPDVKEERDYKDEYKKFQSSTKSKQYRAELNKYNRKKGTYGNGDGKDASHKGGKIVGFESQSKNRGRAEKSRLRKEAVKFNIDKLLKNPKIKKLFSRLGLKISSKDDVMKVLNHFARNPAALAAMKGLFGETINEATSSKDFFSGYKVTTMDQKKAIAIAKKMSGNMTGAVKKIEKIKKGLSDDSKVKAALRTANESVNEAKMSDSDVYDYILYMKKYKPDVYKHMVKNVEIKKLLKKFESVNEGGMGILSTDQADILQGLVMRNKNKNIKAILNIVLKSGYFKNVDKKELLGYIDGAKQFVKYMESHPMESIDESGILYRAGVKKYGKEGMRKIQQAAGKRKSHAEIGKIKDKYEKESVGESVNEASYSLKPEKRRKLKHGEVEVMKGRGSRQRWFYFMNGSDVRQLIKLGRNSAFPTGITNNNSKLKFDKNLYIKESDLGLTYKKGKTVKVKHKTSGKSIVITDKPAVIKKYEKLGFIAEGKLNESAVSFWQDMFRPGPIPKKYINQLIKKTGELPSKSHIKAIYRSNGNPSSSELAKTWKQLTKEKYVRAASGMWRWNADFTGWESANEAIPSEIPKSKISLLKMNAKYLADDLMDMYKELNNKDVDAALVKQHLDTLKEKVKMMRKNVGLRESVNEEIEPAGNMAKVAKIVKNKQATKLGGVMIDMQSANLLMKVYDKVSDKDKERMNKLNPKVLTNVIEKLWSRVNLKLPI